jgi:transposase
MPAAYSYDLREKAVSAVERGEKKSHVCRTLKISRNTLDLWLKRREQTGTVEATRNYRRGPQPKIDELEVFKTFAQKYGHLTQTEMAAKWPNPVSKTRIGQALQRIGLTRKKKLMATEKERKKPEKSFSNK